MPGLRNFLIGAAICGVGIIITAATYAAAEGGGSYVVTWGAIIFGGIQAVTGLGQMMAHRASGPEGQAEQKAKIGSHVIIRSMIAVAAADGQLDEGELAIIELICRQIFGAAIPEAQVRSAFDEMQKTPFSVTAEISPVASQVDKEDALLTAKVIGMVAMADGHVSDEELAMIEQIAYALNLSPADLKECLQNAHEMITALLDAQDARAGETPGEAATPA